jgi:hypothetical protein
VKEERVKPDEKRAKVKEKRVKPEIMVNLAFLFDLLPLALSSEGWGGAQGQGLSVVRHRLRV